METSVRTLAKTISWQVLGFISMTAISYVFTGSVSRSGALALTSTIIGTLAYIAHERLWSAVTWGIVWPARRRDIADTHPTTSAVDTRT